MAGEIVDRQQFSAFCFTLQGRQFSDRRCTRVALGADIRQSASCRTHLEAFQRFHCPTAGICSGFDYLLNVIHECRIFRCAGTIDLCKFAFAGDHAPGRSMGVNGRNNQSFLFDPQFCYRIRNTQIQCFIHTQQVQYNQRMPHAVLLQHNSFAEERIVHTTAGSITRVTPQLGTERRGYI